jgi:hypothetical protein
MNNFKSFCISISFSLLTATSLAQKNNPSTKSDSVPSIPVNYTEDTFLSTRVINGQSTEGITQGRLDFRVQHRFDPIKNGYAEFFGLDHAFTFLGLEYGIKDWIMVGLNRTSATQAVTGFTKINLMRQITDSKNHPISVSFFIGSSYKGQSFDNPPDFSSRLSYTTEILIARKFGDSFSAQVSPIWIHRNRITSLTNSNDLFALGMSAHYSLSPTLSLSGEYYPVINPSVYFNNNNFNSLSFSLDIKTPGHVFQIVLTNSNDMIEKNFVGETTGSWLKGDIHLGFNILRKFDL